MAFSGQSNNNGTGGTPKGQGFAGYSSAQLSNNATFWESLNSFQFGLGVETGSSAAIQIGARIGHNPNHAVKGSLYDTALDFVDDTTATIGWDALITSSNVGGSYPIAATGTFIRTLGAQTFANGIDFSSATITSNFLLGPSSLFGVTGVGVVTGASYKIAAATVLSVSGNDLLLTDTSTHVNMTLGNATSAVNFYDQTTHSFRSRTGTSFVSINAAGAILHGSTSGTLTVSVPAVVGTNTLRFPAGSTDFSATGGTSQVVKQTSAGGAFDVAQLTFADLATGTAPAFTLGGTVSGGGNQINNVIIGTSTPLAGFFTIATANSFVPNSATVATNGMYLPAANSIGFATNSTVAMQIDSAQRVGIGGAPTAAFTVSINGTATQDPLRLVNTAAAGFAQIVIVAEARTYQFGVGGSGAPAGFANKFFIYKTTATAGIVLNADEVTVAVLNTTASTSTVTGSFTTAGGLGVAGATFTNTLNVITMAATIQANTVCYNIASGLLTYQVGANCTTSSARYKDDVRPLETAASLDTAMKLKPVSFHYKPEVQIGTDEHVGFLAEDVAQIDRRLVIMEDGRPNNIIDRNILAVLTGAIQGLKADNDNIRAEFDLLSTKVAR
jgi:hypothetical protein